jgi:hypothetical protein
MEVWESREKFEAFAESVREALQEISGSAELGGAVAPEFAPDVFPLHDFSTIFPVAAKAIFG